MQGLDLTGEELDEFKKDLLLNNLECTHFKTIVDHVGAIGSKTTTYSKIVSYMATRHQEKINVFYERFNFGNRSRRGNETIMEFLGALKDLSVNCDFGDQVDERIRDQFVLKLKDESIHQDLMRRFTTIKSTLDECFLLQ
ncbi:hypothetical protein RF11_06648 [Thelohanellus kitauei]|uniref:Retrotransposon gag domain-containing protein n=1 Tax=Thelohanellus kitauei TaxID=669202 RepID=A0A0C2MCE7_THEKT|nr:hypothetical protein RF11_06648 [Thelohanellus kitauei]